MRTARARRSPGTWSRRSSRPSRCAAWCSTRSPRSAIAAAVADPREIDDQLVDAQETRRILDRLYGYEVSPVLWKKVLPRLSAGRVQSVATRMVVERERARMAFHSAEYWDVAGHLRPGRAQGRTTPRRSPRRWSASTTVRLATGRDFDPATGRRRASVLHLDEAGARGLAARLDGREFAVQGVEEKPYRRRPYAAVHDEHAAAGGRPQVPLVGAAGDAHRAAALRERLHHLHAHRLDEPVDDGADRGAHARPASCTATPTCRPSRAPTTARSRTPRRRTRRSVRPVTRSAPRARSPTSSTPRSSGSTS